MELPAGAGEERGRGPIQDGMMRDHNLRHNCHSVTLGFGKPNGL